MTTQKTAELAPCYLCNSTEVVVQDFKDTSGRTISITQYFVYCKHCGAEGSSRYSEDKARAAWNRCLRMTEREAQP